MNIFLKKANKFISNPKARFSYLDNKGLYDNLNDERYLKKAFKAHMGYELDLENPKTFNEKLQWLKLYNRKPEYTMMVDKYKVREYIADKIGEEYLIPLIGVWDDPEDIEFEKLPERFVLKCNHNSGTGMCICKDKSKLDIPKVKKELRKGLQEDYYLKGREWPYKNVPRKIICEQYMEDRNSVDGELIDYKFMCFDGEVKAVYTCTNRFTDKGVNITFFDKEWIRLPFSRDYCESDLKTIESPKTYAEMLSLAERLSEGILFSRIDFYEINKKCYFGEITFFPASGFSGFNPKEWDLKLGKYISINNKA